MQIYINKYNQRLGRKKAAKDCFSAASTPFCLSRVAIAIERSGSSIRSSLFTFDSRVDCSIS